MALSSAERNGKALGLRRPKEKLLEKRLQSQKRERGKFAERTLPEQSGLKTFAADRDLGRGVLAGKP